MKVRVLYRMTVNGSRIAAGETVEMATDEAKKLIEAKYAEKVKEPKPEPEAD